MSAHAPACQPHAIHRTLLAIKHQNPQLRFVFEFDATSQAAASVTAIAGH